MVRAGCFPSRWQRRGGQRATVRPGEAGLAVVSQCHREAFFVHRPVMAATQEHQVVEPRRSTLRPVADVMCIAVASAAAGEAAPAVSCRQRPAEGRRYGAGLSPDIEHLTRSAVPHHDGRGVAGDPPRSLRGNVRAILQHRLTDRLVALQDPVVDMDDDLIPIAGGPTVEVCRQGRFGYEPEGVGPPLTRGRLRGASDRSFAGVATRVNARTFE